MKQFQAYYYDKTYDKRGNVIAVTNNDDYWEKREYDKNNNQTLFKDSLGNCIKRTYDEFSRQITSDYKLGTKKIYRYPEEV